MVWGTFQKIASMAVFLFCLPMMAFSQQANGTITVQVVTGAMILGVSVTLSSVGLIGGDLCGGADIQLGRQCEFMRHGTNPIPI